MAAAVRVFSHSELEVLPVSAGSARYSTDSVFVVSQPYLAKELLSADVSQVDTVAATAPAGTRILRVEVEVGKRIAYEITPRNQTLRTVSATQSPTLEGRNTLPFGEGARFSAVEIT